MVNPNFNLTSSYFQNVLQQQALQSSNCGIPNIWEQNPCQNYNETSGTSDFMQMFKYMMILDQLSKNDANSEKYMLLMSMMDGNSDMLSMLMALNSVSQNQPKTNTANDTDGKTEGIERYDSKKGRSLARSAQRVISSVGSSLGNCAAGVRRAFEKLGISKGERGDAWLWASKLKKRDDFAEVEVDPQDLKKLPAGAIVVWDKTKKSPYGHISIATGDGYELSDHKAKQLTNLRGETSCRVFIPVA
jgi:hypothetical protein